MPSATVDWPARRFVKSVFSATSGLKHSHSLNLVSVCVLEPMEEKEDNLMGGSYSNDEVIHQ